MNVLQCSCMTWLWPATCLGSTLPWMLFQQSPPQSSLFFIDLTRVSGCFAPFNNRLGLFHLPHAHNCCLTKVPCCMYLGRISSPSRLQARLGWRSCSSATERGRCQCSQPGHYLCCIFTSTWISLQYRSNRDKHLFTWRVHTTLWIL